MFPSFYPFLISKEFPLSSLKQEQNLKSKSVHAGKKEIRYKQEFENQEMSVLKKYPFLKLWKFLFFKIISYFYNFVILFFN